MERLTSKYNGENILLCGYCDGDQCDKEDCAAECPCKCEQDAIDRLAYYEDAEEQGLLVRLPCKVGDTLYSPRENGILEQLVDYICMEEDEIYIHVSFCCDCDCDGCPHNNWQTTHEDEHYCDGEYGNGIFVVNDFGKTVFLTRTEAGAAKGGLTHG